MYFGINVTVMLEHCCKAGNCSLTLNKTWILGSKFDNSSIFKWATK